MKCKKCKKNHNGTYGSGIFCSVNCANSRGPRSNKFKSDVSNKLKKDKTCTSCNILLNKRGRYCISCVNFSKNKDLFKKLNIIETNFQIANTLAISILEKEYFDNKLSTPQLFEKYGLQPIVISKFLYKNNIKLRNISNSISNSYYTGRKKINDCNRFKQGIHVTWDGIKIFYRSSYELDYAIKLDKMKIKYQSESLRIRYWDSQLKKERTAIPDFYLPKDNLIIEIKSNYTYDKINIRDKCKAYKKLGYKFKLELLTSREIST